MAAKKKVTKKKTSKKVSKKVSSKKKAVKKIKEETFDVTMKSDDISSRDVTTTVDAEELPDTLANMEDGSYDSVGIKKKKTFGNKPKTSPESANVKTEPRGLGENIDFKNIKYPFIMSLPIGFNDIIKNCLQESPTSYMITESVGRISIRVENSDNMKQFLESLIKNNKDPLINVVINGIGGSIK